MKFFASAALAWLVACAPVRADEPAGKKVFERHCVYCHGTSVDAPGTLQLARTRGKDQALLAERRDLAAEYIRYVVRHGLKSMPPFAPSDLDEAQLRALTNYLGRR